MGHKCARILCGQAARRARTVRIYTQCGPMQESIESRTAVGSVIFLFREVASGAPPDLAHSVCLDARCCPTQRTPGSGWSACAQVAACLCYADAAPAAPHLACEASGSSRNSRQRPQFLACRTRLGGSWVSSACVRDRAAQAAARVSPAVGLLRTARRVWVKKGDHAVTVAPTCSLEAARDAGGNACTVKCVRAARSRVGRETARRCLRGEVRRALAHVGGAGG